MGKKLSTMPFPRASYGALATEHELIATLLREIGAKGIQRYLFGPADLDVWPRIASSDREQNVRMVRALVMQLEHLNAQCKAIAKPGGDYAAMMNQISFGAEVFQDHMFLSQLLQLLLRRKLPFQPADLASVGQMMLSSVHGMRGMYLPLSEWLRAYDYCHESEWDHATLSAVLRSLTQALAKETYPKRLPKLALEYDRRVRAETSDEAPQKSAVPTPIQPDLMVPAPVGAPDMLLGFKMAIGALPRQELQLEAIGPDQSRLPVDSPLREEHELIGHLMSDVAGTPEYSGPHLARHASGRTILSRHQSDGGRILIACAERIIAPALEANNANAPQNWQARYTAVALFHALSQTHTRFSRHSLFDFLLVLTTAVFHREMSNSAILDEELNQMITERWKLTPGERHVIHRLRCLLLAPPLGDVSNNGKEFNRILGDNPLFVLVPGEVWSDAVNAYITGEPPKRRAAWIELFRHLVASSGSRPSAKWLATAAQLVRAIGNERVADALNQWFPLVKRERSLRMLMVSLHDSIDPNGLINEGNADALRGLLWIAPMLDSTDLPRVIGSCAASCYRKIPGVGPRAVKVGNACIYALSQIGNEAAVGQLAVLKVKVKFGTAQKEIEKAMNVAAAKLKLPRDQIEEMGVPAYGLEGVGATDEKFGSYRAELRVAGPTDVVVRWFDETGKALNSIPSRVKSDFKEELKELQQSAKDIAAMALAQRDRIDSLFLAQKQWKLPIWRERYIDHPLVGVLGRRLIWHFQEEGQEPIAAIWNEGGWIDGTGRSLGTFSDATTVQLWHPIQKPVEEVVRWRTLLEQTRIVQPFKQAHREVYILTDAERTTNTYSNRFAAHVLRQHQFNALAAARGWKNKLRLMVDDSYPPATKDLPAWGLRAEFWIEGIGDNYGVDTADSGAFLRVSTDQVRFYAIDAAQNVAAATGGGYITNWRHVGPGEPISLERIPPLVLSEVMRDVDLFVGVASVGNDPNWADGGPDGRYRDYWHDFSFGSLSETAITRRDVLSRLLPKLKIASRCTLQDRFLQVRGDLRTYRIHLGSGNILMEPNDQYLCIVPARGAAAQSTPGELFLPFEGDTVLSIILSKAFMLADDGNIKDPAIVGQIRS